MSERDSYVSGWQPCPRCGAPVRIGGGPFQCTGEGNHTALKPSGRQFFAIHQTVVGCVIVALLIVAALALGVVFSGR